MDGHHLVLGELADFLTGEILEDSHDERYRQKLARFLVEEKGYAREEVIPRQRITVRAGENRGIVPVDFLVKIGGQTGMMVKYGPGSLITRHRPALALSRIIAPCRIPVVIVTNGEDADVLDSASGKCIGSGFRAVPSRSRLVEILAKTTPEAVPEKRMEMESRIVYAYEVDGACPCDTTVCRLNR